MPLLKLDVSVPVTDDQKQKLLVGCSRLLARLTGKPELYVMVTVQTCAIAMGGKPGPAAFADVRGIGGLKANTNVEISKELCALLKQELELDPRQVYMNFTTVEGDNWGWNGGTFG